MSDKPFSPSCERNRDPILAVLRERFADRHHVLEIGSGTGQHAVHFAAAMPWLAWQCSDLADNLPGIRQWLDEARLPNTPPPIELDVRGTWPPGSGALPFDARPFDARPFDARPFDARPFDAVFTANSLHIMGWTDVQVFFAGVGAVLADDATLVVYGPFNYGGRYTSDSNREFDGWLQARDPRSGIRDFEAVDALARAIGMTLVEDAAMPANNRCLAWRRGASRRDGITQE